MGDHGAIWVSAVMFGLLHLYNPLGMPMLIVVGAGLGYMRLVSGGMLLPMLMHGFHNALVIALEGNV
jgi:membrane protease YdiL (CAAX protease family)